MNETFNLTGLIGQGDSCFVGGSLKASCIIDKLCPQVTGYIHTWAAVLFLAVLGLDLIVPLCLFTILPRLAPGLSMGLCAVMGCDDKEDARQRYSEFVRSRLLLACLLFSGYAYYLT